jgi:hypothetical protein
VLGEDVGELMDLFALTVLEGAYRRGRGWVV